MMGLTAAHYVKGSPVCNVRLVAGDEKETFVFLQLFDHVSIDVILWFRGARPHTKEKA